MKNLGNQIHFAFYGSLREGHYNHARLVKPASGVVFDGVERIAGYKLFDTGYGYPFIKETKDPADSVVVELYQIPDRRYAESIHRMELGAGYVVNEVVFNDQTYWVYCYDRSSEGRREVRGGDWNEFTGVKSSIPSTEVSTEASTE